MVFQILGPLEVRHRDGAVPVRGSRERAVLAVLLLEQGRPVPLANLVEAVWDGEPPQAAEKAVRNAVSALRGRFAQSGVPGVVIETNPAGYRLRLQDGWLDMAEFRDRVSAGRELAVAGRTGEAVAKLRAGLELWRGPTLAGTTGGWVIDAATARLDEQRLAAWEECLELELELGRHREVGAELEGLAEEWPLRERIAGLLMLARYRSGRQAEALEAYHGLAGRLAEELGIDPSAEIVQLHEAILRQDPALDLESATASEPDAGSSPAAQLPVQAMPAQLPLDVSGFAGRMAELARLHALLPSAEAAGGGTVVISAIGGTAGVGKTALAVHFAHEVASRFPDGQLYVNLQGFGPSGTPVAPVAALRGFLLALGVAAEAIPADEADQSGLYRSLLAGKRVLVVLDNARDAGQVRPLLPGSPGCLVVVTSRSELTGLVAAEGARPLVLDVLSAAEAAELLAFRLGRERLDREPGTAEELTSLCSGLPLAVAIVAARAAARPGLALADLADELQVAQSRLDALETGDPATSVRAVFSWSYRQLAEAAARVFRLAGLHPGRDLTVPAAASLAGIPPGEAHRLLEKLTQAHLLIEHTPGRYCFHDLLRAYAADLATAPGAPDDPRAALTRLFDHYLATAAAAMDLLHPGEAHYLDPDLGGSAQALPNLQAARAWLDAERPALVAITAHTAAHGWHSHAIRFAAVLHRYFQGGHYTDAVAVYRAARDAARLACDHRAEADALRWLGTAYSWQDAYERAADHIEQALTLYRQTGDLPGQAWALGNLAAVDWYQGRTLRAVQHWEHSLALSVQVGDHASQAITLSNLGDALPRLGRSGEAFEYLLRALDLARMNGHRDIEAYALNNLGEAEARLGRPEQGAKYLMQARMIFRELGHRTGEARSLTNLGVLHASQGRAEQAARCHRQAATLFHEVRERDGEAAALNGLGEAVRAAGHPSDAVSHHTAAFDLARGTGSREEQARAHAGLGGAYAALSRPGRARGHFQHALDIYTDLGYPEAEQIRLQLATLAGAAHWKPVSGQPTGDSRQGIAGGRSDDGVRAPSVGKGNP